MTLRKEILKQEAKDKFNFRTKHVNIIILHQIEWVIGEWMKVMTAMTVERIRKIEKGIIKKTHRIYLNLNSECGWYIRFTPFSLGQLQQVYFYLNLSIHYKDSVCVYFPTLQFCFRWVYFVKKKGSAYGKVFVFAWFCLEVWLQFVESQSDTRGLFSTLT